MENPKTQNNGSLVPKLSPGCTEHYKAKSRFSNIVSEHNHPCMDFPICLFHILIYMAHVYSQGLHPSQSPTERVFQEIQCTNTSASLIKDLPQVPDRSPSLYTISLYSLRVVLKAMGMQLSRFFFFFQQHLYQ